MKNAFRIAYLAAAGLLAGPAIASTGQLDTFSASSLNIKAGETVDFSASFSIGTDSYSNGGSNPIEPEPVEGYQVWAVNWYQSWSESVTEVQLQAGGASYLASGSSSGSWSFSSTFDTPGTYVMTLTGGWTTRSEQYISTETASRNCYNADPERGSMLTCDGWQWSYYDNTDSSEYSSGFAPLSLTIEVTAVPEPATLALLLAGLGLVAAAAARRAEGAGGQPSWSK